MSFGLQVLHITIIGALGLPKNI